MRFKKGTRRKPIEYEKDLVLQWKKNRTFEKSVEMRPKENSYVFMMVHRSLPVCRIMGRC